MKNIHIASVITPDMLEQAYILMHSIKNNKQVDTRINYYLFIEFTPEHGYDFCKGYLHDLFSFDFHIFTLDVDFHADKINALATPRVVFLRLLFPQIFNALDKIIHLDIDMVCVKDGIEELWDMPLDYLYLRAVIDPPIHFCPGCHDDFINTGNPRYFNAGMMLMNLAQIRQDHKDDELARWCLKWDSGKLRDIHRDQTILNYVLKDHVSLIPFKWNNMVFGISHGTRDSYAQYLKTEGFNDPLESLDDAVFLHFVGPGKPWNEKEMAFGEKVYPYAALEMETWDQIIKGKYRKREY